MREMPNTAIDTAICGANLLVNLSDLDTILSLILTAVLLIAAVVRYVIVIAKAAKDGKVTGEEKTEIDNAFNDLKDTIKKAESKPDTPDKKQNKE